MNEISKIIVEKANSFIGMEEVPGNLDFKDDEFRELMISVGWEKGQAWCSYFVELVWKLAYVERDPTFANKLDLVFNAGAMATWNNFRKSKEFVNDNQPSLGCIVIWQYYKDGKPTWMGHAGIVVDFDLTHFMAVEGNTSKAGSREGLIVGLNKRKYNFLPQKNGLVLKGFIHPRII